MTESDIDLIFYTPATIRCKYGYLVFDIYNESTNTARYTGLLGGTLQMWLTYEPVDYEYGRNLRIGADYPYPQGTTFVHKGEGGSETFETYQMSYALDSDYETIMDEYKMSKSKSPKSRKPKPRRTRRWPPRTPKFRTTGWGS